MTISSQTFGQQTISVVLNEGQMPAKLSTDASGNTVVVGADGNRVIPIYTARLGNRAGTPAAQSIPTSTSLTAPYTKIIFGAIELDPLGVCQPDLSTIIVPPGCSYWRATAQLACGAGTYWAGFYACRIYVDGANYCNTRMPVLPGYPTQGTGVPSTNVLTQTPWVPVGPGLDSEEGSTIDVRLFQNSGGALSMPWDTTSTWFYVEFM